MNQIKPLDQVLPIGADAHNHVTKVVNKFGSRDSILYKLKEFSSSVPDFRRSDKGNIRHKLDDIIMLMILGRASGCIGRAEIIEFGKHNLNKFRKMGMLRNGVPSEATAKTRRTQRLDFFRTRMFIRPIKRSIDLNDMRAQKWAIYLLIAFCTTWVSQAQTVKQIEVSQNVPYTDHLSLVKGSNDMDLIVKFIFDETENTLTASLISYKRLFVFQSDTRYSQAVRFCKLRPDRLSYVVESDENARYKMVKSLRKSLSKPKRKHLFKRWITTEGLQPQPVEYKMVNDYIEQKFDITDKGDKVTVELHDVLMMELASDGKKKKYELFFQTDLDRKYEIIIRRDPCFGKEEATALASKRKEDITASYNVLRQHYQKLSMTETKENAKVFNEMRILLLEQYLPLQETYECPDIQIEIEQYNAYVDSIRGLQYNYVEEKKKERKEGLSANYVLTIARKIDNNVSRWLLTSDKAEKNDLDESCRKMIAGLNAQIRKTSVQDKNLRDAIAIFRKAEQFYQASCKRQEEGHSQNVKP